MPLNESGVRVADVFEVFDRIDAGYDVLLKLSARLFKGLIGKLLANLSVGDCINDDDC